MEPISQPGQEDENEPKINKLSENNINGQKLRQKCLEFAIAYMGSMQESITVAEAYYQYITEGRTIRISEVEASGFITIVDFGEGQKISVNLANKDVSIQNDKGYGVVAHFDNLCLFLKDGFKADISI